MKRWRYHATFDVEDTIELPDDADADEAQDVAADDAWDALQVGGSNVTCWDCHVEPDDPRT